MRPEVETRAGVRCGLPAVLVALVAVVVGLAVNLGDRPMSAHEIFAAQTAREMVRSGDWVSPTFNGQSRLKKPPLAYWAQASASRALGAEPPVAPWVARLPSALAAGALAGMTVLLGARVFGREVGVTAGLMACGTMGVAVYGSSARPDMLYGACCTLAVLGWTSASLRGPGERGQGREALMGWFGAGLATLAKGPHMPLVLLLGVIVHLLVARRRGEIVRVLRPLAGVGVLLAVTAPWVAAVLVRHPDAPALWWSELFAGRADAKSLRIGEWLEPYYLYALPGLLLPWSVLLPFGLFAPFVRGRDDLARGRVLFWIVVVTVAVMSIPNHRRDYYMLPIVAPLSALIAAGAADWLARTLERRAGLVRAGGAFAGVLVAGLLAAAGAVSSGGARVAALAGSAAVVLIAVTIAVRPAGAHALLRLLGAAAVIGWIAIAPGALMFDDYSARASAFAQRVDARVGDGERLVMFRESDRSLTYGQVVYMTDRIVPEFDDAGRLAAMASEGPFWVVLAENDLPAVEAVLGVTVADSFLRDDPTDPALLLVRCEARE